MLVKPKKKIVNIKSQGAFLPSGIYIDYISESNRILLNYFFVLWCHSVQFKSKSNINAIHITERAVIDSKTEMKEFGRSI